MTRSNGIIQFRLNWYTRRHLIPPPGIKQLNEVRPWDHWHLRLSTNPRGRGDIGGVNDRTVAGVENGLTLELFLVTVQS